MSGAPDYGPGDLVVALPSPRDRKFRTSGTVRPGKTYTAVSVFFVPAAGEYGVELAEVQSPFGIPYRAANFRKVDPLPDALVSLLKAEPAPVPERVTA